MADLTLGAIERVAIQLHPASRDGRQEPRAWPRPQRARPRAATTLHELLPDADPERYEAVLEFEGAHFLGVVIRDRATGDVLASLSPEELAARVERPGVLVERRG
ncbi:MAG: hypothetical protein RMK15_05945 [Chloroflexota bacterium]|nr:hypothetical protein [Dehalococcoidia bacterium]MDW8046806.1 hypothetical protein [Chloroflexota bacterium]